MDYLDFLYRGTMRAYDGSTFDVDWFWVPDSSPVIEVATPFRSGRWQPNGLFDLGEIGEIPVPIPPRPRKLKIPERLCGNCYLGTDDQWENGWPTGTPGVIIEPDGFPVDCVQPEGAAYDYGYDLGYES